jgi:hypothetical protein
VLIALRVHNAKQLDAQIGTSVGFIPSAWLRDGDSGIEVSQQDSGSIDGVAFRVSEVKSDGHADEAQTFGSSTYPPHKTLPIAHQASDLQ